MVTPTIYPPSTQFVKPPKFDAHQFIKAARVVNGENGIAFSDYVNMSIHTRKQSNERRLPTPTWALNDTMLREVLVNYFETRAQITVRTGTLKKRLERAQTRLKGQSKQIERTLNGLCLEYTRCKRVAEPDMGRLRQLRVEIENLDTRLRFLDREPGVVLRVVHLYHRARLDSVGVALVIGIKPPHVRTILHRLGKTWARMNNKPHTSI